MWLIAVAPTWMLGWNMMLMTGETPATGSRISAPTQQGGDIRSAEFRQMDENHPDLPDPEEPTTDGDWSELVSVEPWAGTNGP